jgi:alkylation response protein AidB-like acyl-CoA dehydrogenase
MTALEGVVLYEELGRALAPTPHFASAVLCGTALARSGSAEQQAQWLEPIATGEAIVTPAWFEPENSGGPTGIMMRAEPDGAGYRLTGTKRHVPFASSANAFVVLARTGDAPTDVDLFLVGPGSDGVSLHQQMTVASDTQFQVTFDSVRVGEDARIGGPRSGWATWDSVMHDGCILLAAQAMGGAQQALDITVQYAKDREQFGQPIGSFQVIKHKCADMLLEVESARSAAHYAGWVAADDGDDLPIAASLAKSYCSEAYFHAAAESIQIHGGIGFTWEHPIHLYFKRAKSSELLFGDGSYHRELLAQRVGI